MVGKDGNEAIEKEYFDLLSWGGLMVPFNQITEFVFVFLYLII